MRFEWQSTPDGTDISSFRDAQDWVYTADNVTASWSVAMNIDDNFVVTEHGFDIQSYKITNYVTSYQFNSLKKTVDGKVDKVTGKGLSTNDFTTALKTKLNNDYTKSQIDTKISTLQTDINTTNSNITTLQTGLTELRNGKANVADVYTKTETDTKISALQDSKADLTYVNSAVEVLATSKADKTDVYTKAETNSKLDEKCEKKAINSPTTMPNTVLLNDNTETRLISSDISTLTLTTPETIPAMFECWLSFKSGATPTTLTYSATPIKWVGADCDSTGDFVPAANRIYEIGIKNIGNDSEGNPVIIARVGAC